MPWTAACLSCQACRHCDTLMLMLNTVWLFFIGAVIGVAHVVPGVSGSTFAVIFNVYDRLIAVITPRVKKILAEWKFLLPMALGTVAGVLAFAKAFTYLYDRFKAPVMCFFAGIIAGSLPLIYKRACRSASRLPPPSGVVCVLAAFALVAFMAFARAPDDGVRALPLMTAPLFAYLFASGVFSAVAMILPGISGSFIMLIMGVYQPLMGAVDEITNAFIPWKGSLAEALSRSFAPCVYITPVVCGIVLGTFCGAAAVRLLMRRAPLQTYGAILGLIAGSLPVVFPAGAFGGYTLVSALLCAAGFALSYLCSRVEGKE